MRFLYGSYQKFIEGWIFPTKKRRNPLPYKYFGKIISANQTKMIDDFKDKFPFFAEWQISFFAGRIPDTDTGFLYSQQINFTASDILEWKMIVIFYFMYKTGVRDIEHWTRYFGS